jgi:hypothetical protein
MTASRLLLATALDGAPVVPALAQEQGAKNVILAISDSGSFNGRLAADFCHALPAGSPARRHAPTGPSPRSTAWSTTR